MKVRFRKSACYFVKSQRSTALIQPRKWIFKIVYYRVYHWAPNIKSAKSIKLARSSSHVNIGYSGYNLVLFIFCICFTFGLL